MIVAGVINIDFNYKDGERNTVYLYKEDDTFYIEQPYNGIYEVSEDDYKSIKAYFLQKN